MSMGMRMCMHLHRIIPFKIIHAMNPLLLPEIMIRVSWCIHTTSINNHLPTHWTRRQVLSTSLVCKTWFQAIYPRLWTSFEDMTMYSADGPSDALLQAKAHHIQVLSHRNSRRFVFPAKNLIELQTGMDYLQRIDLLLSQNAGTLKRFGFMGDSSMLAHHAHVALIKETFTRTESDLDFGFKSFEEALPFRNLKELQLSRCRFMFEDLLEILRACPGLEKATLLGMEGYWRSGRPEYEDAFWSTISAMDWDHVLGVHEDEEDGHMYVSPIGAFQYFAQPPTGPALTIAPSRPSLSSTQVPSTKGNMTTIKALVLGQGFATSPGLIELLRWCPQLEMLSFWGDEEFWPHDGALEDMITARLREFCLRLKSIVFDFAQTDLDKEEILWEDATLARMVLYKMTRSEFDQFKGEYFNQEKSRPTEEAVLPVSVADKVPAKEQDGSSEATPQASTTTFLQEFQAPMYYLGELTTRALCGPFGKDLTRLRMELWTLGSNDWGASNAMAVGQVLSSCAGLKMVSIEYTREYGLTEGVLEKYAVEGLFVKSWVCKGLETFISHGLNFLEGSRAADDGDGARRGTGLGGLLLFPKEESVPEEGKRFQGRDVWTMITQYGECLKMDGSGDGPRFKDKFVRQLDQLPRLRYLKAHGRRYYRNVSESFVKQEIVRAVKIDSW